VLNKKCVESLILAGAFDSLAYPRRALFENYEKVTVPVMADRRAESMGQESFFGGVAPVLAIDESVLGGTEFDKRELLRYEKEMLGQFVTDHPLLGIKDRLAALTDMEVSEVPTLGDGDVVTVAGIVGAVARRFTKRGEPFALFRLEDLTGGISIVAFPNTFEKSAHLVTLDQVVVVKGRADLRGRELQLVAIEIFEPDLGAAGAGALGGWSNGPGAGAAGAAADPLVVDVPTTACTGGLINRLKELLGGFPGPLPVVVRLVGEGGVTRLKLGQDFSVDGSSALQSELRRLLGPRAVRLTAEDPARV
jgi:DNA polymerase-3 subunit alpha